MKKLLAILIALLLPASVSAAALGVNQGGTGTTTFSQGLVYSNGVLGLTGHLTNVATSSLNLTTSAFKSANISQWTNDAGYLTADPFWVYAYSAVSTSSPVLITASTTIGNGTQAGGLTISGGATTTGNTLLQGKLSDSQGTSQYIYNSWASQLVDISQGTAAAPITVAGPTFKISRTEAVASTTCNSNATDNECNSALVVEDNSEASAASSSQQTNAIWASSVGEPQNTDVVGLTAVGDVVGAGTGIGTGAYLQGRRDTQTGLALGAEIRASNFTTASSVYNPFQISSTSALWITSQSSAAGITNGVGIAFGAIAGSSFNTGIGFTQGSIASTSISDDSTASTSIAIGGVHAVAAIAVAAGAGNSGFGTKTPNAEIDDNGALYVENGNGLRLYGTNSNFSTINYDTTNGKVDATWPFNFQDGITTGSSYAALIPPSGGALFANNVGISTTTAGTVLSLGGVANFTAATSTFYSSGGINLAAGCFAVAGTCISAGGGSGTVLSGTTGQFPYYASNGTTLTATSSIFVTAARNVGVSTTTPAALLDDYGSFALPYGSPIMTDNRYTTNNNILTTAFVSPNDSTSLWTPGNTSGDQIAKFTVLSNGNAGVGTTSPFALLTVATPAGATGATTNLFLVASSTATATTTLFSISNTGTTKINDPYGTNLLTLNTASTTGPIFAVDATTTGNPTLFSEDQYGHLTASSTGATPTIGTCGTGSPAMSANANDAVGSFTTGTSASACTITFAHAYSSTPIVVISDSNTSAVIDVSSISTTAFTVSLASALSAATVYYMVEMP